MRYYVHGAGRSGGDAWPAQRDQVGAVFADHGQTADMVGKATLVARHAPSAPYVLVAHSLGAVAAVLALRDHALTPTHLVLAEPALYDIARGEAPIEEHITWMTTARGRASVGDLFGFWQIVRPMMFAGLASEDSWVTERAIAERLYGLQPPWGHGIDASFAVSVPTLVITGEWNGEYEAIAAVLTRAGATHVTLKGHEHRVQDHPDFDATIEHFVA